MPSAKSEIAAQIERWTPKWRAAHISPSVYNLTMTQANVRGLYAYLEQGQYRDATGQLQSFLVRHHAADPIRQLHTFAKGLVVAKQTVYACSIAELARSIREMETLQGEPTFSEAAKYRGVAHLVIHDFDRIQDVDLFPAREQLELDSWLASHLYDGGAVTLGVQAGGTLGRWPLTNPTDRLPQLSALAEGFLIEELA